MNLGGRTGNGKDVLVKSEEDAGIFVFERRRQTRQHLDGFSVTQATDATMLFPLITFVSAT